MTMAEHTPADARVRVSRGEEPICGEGDANVVAETANTDRPRGGLVGGKDNTATESRSDAVSSSRAPRTTSTASFGNQSDAVSGVPPT